jgi:hypothetical protein
METAILEAAYHRFLAMASGPPMRFAEPSGSWPATLVVAHVAANDDLLAAHIETALAGGDPRYDNRPATDERRLRSLIEEAGDWEGLVAGARAGSARVLELARAVKGELAGRPFHVFILDGDTVQVDEPLPIPALLAAQARVHVPAHTAELERMAARAVVFAR